MGFSVLRLPHPPIMPPSSADMGMVHMNMNSTLGAAFIGNIVGAMQVSLLVSSFGNGSNHDIVI